MPSGTGRGGVSGRRRAGGFGRTRRQPADPDSVEAARARAIGLLSRRDFPRAALKGRLTEAGFAAGAAESAITGLEDERLVNDARYVEASVAGRIARGQGPLRIALELKRLGVDAELVVAALAARAHEWAGLAAELRRRRFGVGMPRTAREKTRQARFLLYRGFTGRQARSALGAERDTRFDALESEAQGDALAGAGETD
jgi:regulatory protein